MTLSRFTGERRRELLKTEEGASSSTNRERDTFFENEAFSTLFPASNLQPREKEQDRIALITTSYKAEEVDKEVDKV